MNETTQTPSEEKEGPMPVVRKPDTGKIELVTPKPLVAYDVQAAKPRKKGFGKSGRQTTPSREQLVQLLLENIEAFSDSEAQLLSTIFELQTLTAQEVMLPLSEAAVLIVGSSPSEVLTLCRASNYHYIPIYNARVDQLIGVVDAMEVLASEHDDDDLSAFVRDVNYVPALKPATDLLSDLRQSEIPIAIVVNEHGSCVGIVELIDILERIIGKVAANRKRTTPHIEKLGTSDWRIDARMLITDVNKVLDIQIPTDQCDTIGGFVLLLLGHLPQKGEKVVYEDVEFNIEAAFKYGVSQIRATKKT
ncbi:CBS domain-containing protein [Candidatus Poribacteria bacterium]|nr:CBS domain-containing protein [Candidatus Poribacteria bacterium]MYH81758.1 CBS domain-containing protein [Candidatus Poribacteria bacterium]MYK95991.1 CBS domain-containing protein [Candidatus Poribacteria bacterium]